ncbi:MAG: recombinase RecT [Bosea sp. (in: a-proteobacteria)]|jgi:recombination protein RecT
MTTDTQQRQDPIAAFRQAIDKMGDQFKSALPQHITVEKFKRTLLTAVQMTPDLLEADRRTLFAAAMRSAQMGLLPDGREGAITAFFNKRAGVKQCQFMPMFAGILKLIRNSGELSSIDAILVHRADRFTYHPGVDMVPVHEPDWFGDRGDAIGVYAVAKMKDGSAYVEIMNRKQIEQVRAVSRSADSGPWRDWWEEMWRKSVIRRLAKRLPLSTDLDGVIHEDDEMFMPPEQPAAPAQPLADPPPADTPRRPSRLAKVAEQAPPPAPADDDGVIDMPPGPPAPPANDDDSPI